MDVAEISIGLNKGRPRIWRQGRLLEKNGFSIGAAVSREVVEERRALRVRLDPEGNYVVSAKGKGDAQVPLLDINCARDLGVFAGMDKVRMIIENGDIWFLPLPSEVQRLERIERARAKLRAGQPLAVGSVSHGVGIMSKALHEGMAQAGLETRLAWACEIDESYLEQAMNYNPIWDASAIGLNVPMQSMAIDAWVSKRLGYCDIVEGGIPCTAHSSAGRSKTKRAHPEEDPNVGHLVVPFIMTVHQRQPLLVVVENVPEYRNSASGAILRNMLVEMGYEVHEDVVVSTDFGSLEKRERMCMVAVTRGVSFDLSALSRFHRESGVLGDFLEPVAEDDDSWRAVTYLKEKEERDKAKGSGFGVKYLSSEDRSVPTFRKGYQKGGSCDARLLHPSDPDKSRLLLPIEHARIKDVDPVLIEGKGKTEAHELLGQAVSNQVFVALGYIIGEAILALRDAPFESFMRKCVGTATRAGVATTEQGEQETPDEMGQSADLFA